MKAIVVDDSRAMRMMLKRMLEGLGFDSILEAGHGGEAMDRLRESGPTDLALVDWNMPMVNGFDFVKLVRAVDAYRSMRVMMVTTEADVGNVTRALEAGADEYLMKPFSKESVAAKLQLLGLT
jgi:two-component system chemotaxis response regulator CheY